MDLADVKTQAVLCQDGYQGRFRYYQARQDARDYLRPFGPGTSFYRPQTRGAKGQDHDYCLMLYCLLLPPASKVSQGSARRLFKQRAILDGQLKTTLSRVMEADVQTAHR